MALREVIYIDLQTGQTTTHLLTREVEPPITLPRGESRALPPRQLAYDTGRTPQANGRLARQVVKHMLGYGTARTVPFVIAAALVDGLVEDEPMPWEEQPTTAPRAPL